MSLLLSEVYAELRVVLEYALHILRLEEGLCQEDSFSLHQSEEMGGVAFRDVEPVVALAAELEAEERRSPALEAEVVRRLLLQELPGLRERLGLVLLRPKYRDPVALAEVNDINLGDSFRDCVYQLAVSRVYRAVAVLQWVWDELSVEVVVEAAQNHVTRPQYVHYLEDLVSRDLEVIGVVHEPERPLEHLDVAERRQELRPHLVEKLLHFYLFTQNIDEKDA